MLVCPKCNKCFFYKSYYMEHTSMSSDCEMDSIEDLITKYSPITICICEGCERLFSTYRGYINHSKKCNEKKCNEKKCNQKKCNEKK